jgi:membrane protease YdiL (CAAX protease family)
MILCLLYARTKSLYPSITLHAINNSIAFGTSQDWGWEIAPLLAASLTCIALAAYLVRRRFGPAPLRPDPI